MVKLGRGTRQAAPAALVRLFSQLAVAARSGLPVGDAMRILVQDDDRDPASRRLLEQIEARTRAGGSLSDALQKSGFPAPTVALVRKAEDSKGLPQVLELLARDYEHNARFRTATRGALTWPAASFVVFVLVLLLMAVGVVPWFESLFSSFEAQLPAPTRLLIWISRVISSWWWVLLALAAILAFVAWSGRGRGLLKRAVLYSALLRLPVVRAYVSKTVSSRLASMLLAAAEGAPLREALGHLVASLGSGKLARAVRHLEKNVAGGLSLEDAVAATPELPGRVRVAVELGRRTDQLAAALRQTIEVSDEDAERSLVRLEQVTLMTAYVFMGVLVALMVLAVYLPIFKMGSVI